MKNILDRNNNYNVMSLYTEGFSGQFNDLKVGGDIITSMGKFVVTTTDITIKNRHTYGCPVHVLDEIFQDNISVIPKW